MGIVVDARRPDFERFARIPGRAAKLRGGRAHQVLIAIARDANSDCYATLSLKDISDATGIDRREIPELERALVSNGLITVERPGRGRRNTYRVILQRADGVGLEPDTSVVSVGLEADTSVGLGADTSVGLGADTSVGLGADTSVGLGADTYTDKRQKSTSTKASTFERARATPFCIDIENWAPSDRDCELSRDRGYSSAWIVDQADRFRDHHIARGTIFANSKATNAAWRNWQRRGFDSDDNPPEPSKPWAGEQLPVPRHSLGDPGDKLLCRLGKVRFNSWFQHVQVKGVQGRTVHLTAPTKFIRKRLHQEFEDDIRACWAVDHVDIQVVPWGGWEG